MKIAVITGASSGLGKEYVHSVLKKYADIEKILIIARREDKLKEIAETSSKIVPVCMDLTSPDFAEKYSEILAKSNADVKLLINNAGFGKLGLFEDIRIEDNAGMIRLNCEAFTIVAYETLKFMKAGAEIINTCSIASFAPNTRMTVYSSTKAYVMSFSRALREELKAKQINVLAVCPGPMDTEFLPVANIGVGDSKTFDSLPRVNVKKIAEKSLVASSKKKAVYTCMIFYKFYRFVAKILPTSLVMKFCGA